MCVWCLSTSANSSSSSMAGKLEATAGYAGTPNSLNSSSSSAVAASVAARDALASAVGDPAGRPNDEKSSSSSSAAAPGHTVPHRVRAQYTGRGARARGLWAGHPTCCGTRLCKVVLPRLVRHRAAHPSSCCCRLRGGRRGGSANYFCIVHLQRYVREVAVCCDPASTRRIMRERIHHCGKG